MSEVPVLWHLSFSHYNEKARWALDYKGIPHVRRAALAAMHVIRAKRLYGGQTFPALSIDGKVIGGSDRIVAALEERWPDPPLYPANEVQRRLALELEQFFGKELGPHIRRWLFFHALPTGDMPSTLSQGFSLPARAAYGLMFPVTKAAMRKALRIDETGAELGWRKTLAAFDRVEDELGPSGYLVGDHFSVADLTAASLFYPLVRPPGMQYEVPDSWPAAIEEARDSVAGRPAFKWVEEMWQRHRGTSAEVASNPS